MYFNWAKIKQRTFNPISCFFVGLIIASIIYTGYLLRIENSHSNISEKNYNITNIVNEDTKNKAVIIINGQLSENYLVNYLKKQGFFLINLEISTSGKSNDKNVVKPIIYHEHIIVQNDVSQILDSLKSLLKNKSYSFGEVFAFQQPDIELADVIREFIGKSSSGEVFRSTNQDKVVAIDKLNQSLRTNTKSKVVTVKEFSAIISQESLPCRATIMDEQQVLSTHIVAKPSDISSVLEKLNSYKAPNARIWLQPYHENVYRLQVTSVNKLAHVVALWREKIFLTKEGSQGSFKTLIGPKEEEIISSHDLSLLSQKLIESLHLKNGTVEFVLAIHKNQVEVIDYDLSLPNLNQSEVMERVIGYSMLSDYLMRAGLISGAFIGEKSFKNIVSFSLTLENKDDLLKLSILPTFYRFYPSHLQKEETPLSGELYLVHDNRDLIKASYAGIRNKEYLRLHPLSSSHSASNIVNFYRDAAANKPTDYKLKNEKIPDLYKERKKSLLDDEDEALGQLYHEREHIPKYVKPLDSTSSIQDVMRYYVSIYDLYILHGKPPSVKVTAMNTGNPAFLPFPPIVQALRKSLEENLISYARYSMQVPEADFIAKLTQYCKEEKILAPRQKLEEGNVVIGHGSTNVYYLALKSIIKNKGDIVLITRPTYGLFIDPVYTAGGEIGFVDLQESEGWKVQPEKLHETIHFYNQKAFNTYILTVFLKEYERFVHALNVFNIERQSIPPMPNLEGITDLKIFDHYIEELNTYINNITDPAVNKDELRFSFSPRVRAFYHMNPHNPTGTVYTRKDLEEIASIICDHPGIYVIDDLAHWGVLYEKIEPATFGSLATMFEKTLTLISLSKSYCVPGLRTGIAIGSAEIVKEMQYRLLNSSSSASYPAMLALDTVLSSPKKERDSYLESNSKEYFFRRNLMGALVDGIQHVYLEPEQKIRIYQLILESEYQQGKPFDKNFLNFILSGMPLVRTLTQPKGCFFHLLDISPLIGAKIGNNPPLQTAADVRNALYSICNIDTVPGEMSGNFFNYSLRMSFSLTPQQIYNACKDINLFIGHYVLKYNPSLLEKSSSSGHAFKPKNIDVWEESIFNRALVRLYLNQATQGLTAEQAQIDASQDLSKEQNTAGKIHAINGLMAKLLDKFFNQITYKEINNYIENNQSWLREYIVDFEQFKEAIKSILILKTGEK